MRTCMPKEVRVYRFMDRKRWVTEIQRCATFALVNVYDQDGVLRTSTKVELSIVGLLVETYRINQQRV
jgi:hypothetical protein